MAPFALGSRGVESLLRHRSLLGALVFRDCLRCRSLLGALVLTFVHVTALLGALVLRAYCVIARCLAPCSQMFALPLALRSLGVQNLLRERSLLGALVRWAFYVTVPSWEPWC